MPCGAAECFAVKLMHPENRRRSCQYLSLTKGAYDTSLDRNRYWVMDMTDSPAFRAEGPKIFRNWLPRDVVDMVGHFLPEDFRMVAHFERKAQLLEVWLAFRGTSNLVEAGYRIDVLLCHFSQHV